MMVAVILSMMMLLPWFSNHQWNWWFVDPLAGPGSGAGPGPVPDSCGGDDCCHFLDRFLSLPLCPPFLCLSLLCFLLSLLYVVVVVVVAWTSLDY